MRTSSSALPLLLFVVVVALACSSGYAAPRKSRCIAQAVIENAALSEPENIWLRDAPIELTARDGSKVKLTFSNDTELSMQETFRIFQSDPKAFQKLEKEVLEQLGKYTVRDLMEDLGLSKKQFEIFALRKGIPRGQRSYSITELSPRYFALMWDRLESRLPSRLETISENIQKTFTKVLRNRGYPIQTTLEESFFEIAHESSVSSPKAFREYITRLHKDVQAPETHLHLGLPDAAINAKEAQAIARAQETKVVLGVLRNHDDFNYLQEATYNFGSPLANYSERGFVFLKDKAFSKPHLAHDLEFRQFDNLEHGMELVQSSVNLAKNRDRLKIIDQPFGRLGIRSFYAGNLNGALEYAGTLFDTTSDEALKQLGKKLKQLAKEVVESNGAPSLPLWKKIHNTLRDEKVLEKLNDELFLKAK